MIVFPRYVPGARTTLARMPKSRAFAKLAANSFNYEILGPEGFEAMGTLIEQCACFRLKYSRLEEAIGVIDHEIARCANAETAKRVALVH